MLVTTAWVVEALTISDDIAITDLNFNGTQARIRSAVPRATI